MSNNIFDECEILYTKMKDHKMKTEIMILLSDPCVYKKLLYSFGSSFLAIILFLIIFSPKFVMHTDKTKDILKISKIKLFLYSILFSLVITVLVFFFLYKRFI